MNRAIIERDLKAALDDGYRAGVEAATPKWISVDERLPESEVPVLLLYKSGYRVIGYWYDDFAEWDDMSDAQVSHPDFWMPLPEPPKEG